MSKKVKNLKSVVTSIISNLKLLEIGEKFIISDLVLPAVWNSLNEEEQEYVLYEFYDMYKYVGDSADTFMIFTDHVFVNVVKDSNEFYTKYFNDIISESYENALKGDKGIFLFQDVFCKLHGKEWNEYSNYEKGLMNKMFYNLVKSNSWLLPKVKYPRIRFKGFNSQCKHQYIKVTK